MMISAPPRDIEDALEGNGPHVRPYGVCDEPAKLDTCPSRQRYALLSVAETKQYLLRRAKEVEGLSAEKGLVLAGSLYATGTN